MRDVNCSYGATLADIRACADAFLIKKESYGLRGIPTITSASVQQLLSTLFYF